MGICESWDGAWQEASDFLAAARELSPRAEVTVRPVTVSIQGRGRRAWAVVVIMPPGEPGHS